MVYSFVKLMSQLPTLSNYYRGDTVKSVGMFSLSASFKSVLLNSTNSMFLIVRQPLRLIDYLLVNMPDISIFHPGIYYYDYSFVTLSIPNSLSCSVP